jgi:hypothetical protein
VELLEEIKKEKKGIYEEFSTLPIRPLSTDPHLFCYLDYYGT